MQRSAGHYRVWVAILNTMLSGPVTLRELSDRAGVSYETVRPLMNELHKGQVVHITSWRSDSLGRESIAVYQLGLGVDAQRKAARTGAQRSLKYANRKQDEQDRRKARRAKPAKDKLVTNNLIDTALRGWAIGTSK